MLRSALVGLDGSAYSDCATQLGIAWAREYDARLCGIGIVDRPSLLAKASQGSVLLGQMNEGQVSSAQHHVDNLIELFSLRCKEAGVNYEVLEEFCPPCEGILLEAQRHDVIMLGQKTYFHGEKLPSGDTDTVAYIIKHNPRPVIAVPQSLPDGDSIVIAYDGSIPAARALEAFRASEFWKGLPVHVISFDRDLERAKAHAAIATDYLRSHHLEPQSHTFELGGSAADAILEQAKKHNAKMLVMGAYGKPQLKEFLVGSVTRSVLKHAPMPVFLYH